MIDRRTFLAATSAALLVGAKRPSPSAARVPEPFSLLDNRPFVTVQVIGRRGKTRELTCWFDTGGGRFALTKDVATALEIRTTGPEETRGDARITALAPLSLNVNGIEIPIQGDQAAGAIAASSVDPGVRAQGFLPGHYLSKHRVLIDYPARRFGLDQPADVGAASLPVQIDPTSGFPRLDCVIDGEHVGLLLDTGASLTMLSRAFIDKLAAKHPAWKSANGAYGPANMMGSKTELDSKMLRVAQIGIGAITLTDVVAVSRRTGTFEQWMSGMMTAPIVGALGGNALRNLRLQIDYPQNTVTAIRSDQPVAHEFDAVPITLTPSYTGYTIAGVMADSKLWPLRDALTGKTLVSVDDQAVAQDDLATVLSRLRGEPGSTRQLKVAGTSGAVQTIDAGVIRIL